MDGVRPTQQPHRSSGSVAQKQCVQRIACTYGMNLSLRTRKGKNMRKKKVTKQHILKQGSKSSTNKNPATPKSTTGSPTRDSRNHVLLRPLSKGRPLSRSSHHRRLRGNYDAHSCVRHLERGPPSGNSFYFCVQRTWSSRNLHCHWSPCCHPYQGLFDRY